MSELYAGRVMALPGRQVRVCGLVKDGSYRVVRDHRLRVAVRNVASNRLSYIPEWRLFKLHAAASRTSPARKANDKGGTG
jgi:hypothetical protein